MHWPQITAIVLMSLEVGLSLAQHGKPRDNCNAWITIIGCAVFAALLKAGGFFG